MKNKSFTFILLISILSLSLLIFISIPSKRTEAGNSKEFISGCELAPYYDFDKSSSQVFFIDIESVDNHKLKDIRLVKNYGPNGEEALKISTGPQYGRISVCYSPVAITKGKYKMSISYKADLKIKESTSKEGASIVVYVSDYIIHNILLNNTNEWNKVEYIFDYPHTFYSSGMVSFGFNLGYLFGFEKAKASGTIYFINFTLEKLEG